MKNMYLAAVLWSNAYRFKLNEPFETGFCLEKPNNVYLNKIEPYFFYR